MLSKLFGKRRSEPNTGDRCLYLEKDSNDFVSWCECEKALASFPSQMDCPWCGCGWLFTCTKCRKAFTFARAVSVPRSIRSIGQEDVERFGGDTSEENVSEWVAAMSEMLSHIEEGRRYVYFDGYFIPADSGPIEVEGWHSNHRLKEVPQVSALADKSLLDELLANRDYWLENAVSST